MENEVEQFHEKQFRRIGMIEAYNDALKSQMLKGEPQIIHGFSKEVEGDKVSVQLYLQKYPALDAYEIKKFELSLQKAGQDNMIGQTFYIGEAKLIHASGGKLTYRQNRYTLKEGYNLLSGRAVHKQLVGREGDPFEAWVKLDMKSKLANGNYETNFFTDKYGFSLDKVLKEYPIKELSNIRYTISLIESLHRGNLQSVTFMHKNGAEEKLFVTPDLKTGSLQVYDHDKQPLPVQQLVARNLISRQFGEKLLEIEQLRQEQKTEQKKDQQQQQRQGAAKDHKPHQRIR